MIDLKALQALTSTMKVLYTEDEDAIREEITRYLQRFFLHVDSGKNGQEGLELYKNNDYDMVISDISMPIMNGLEMSREIRAINENQEIIIVSAYSSSEYFTESIEIGVSGYIIKPVDFTQMKDTLYRSALKINAIKEAENFKKNLETIIQKRTDELEESVENERKLQDYQIDNYEKTILSFIEMVERRDTYTAGHSQRVAEYSKMIAQDMGYSDDDVMTLYQAAMLHDIGKIATPDSVLLKPGKLNELEFTLIKEHVSTSYNLLKKIPMYKELAHIIHYHHEKFNGKGYPHGAKAEEIPPLSRIMIVADAFDAMTTNRIYKGRMSLEDALDELKNFTEIQFHPEVVKSALEVLKDVKLDENISQLPSSKLEEERFAYFFKDLLTDVYSKSYLEFILIKNKEDNLYKHITGVFIGNFTNFNVKYGWEDGDKLLADIATELKESFSDSLVFRIHGDDFLLLSKEVLHVDLSKLHNLDILKYNDIDIKLIELTVDEIDNNISELEKILPS